MCQIHQHHHQQAVSLCARSPTRGGPQLQASRLCYQHHHHHHHHHLHHHHHHHHYHHQSFSCTPLTGPRLTLRSVSPSNCLKEVIESATLNPLCYPNSYLSELQPEAAVPDFHWRGLVGQFATGRQHLP